jgi:O-antigen ligase
MRFITQMSVLLMCFAACTTGWHPRRLQQLVVPPLFLLLASSLALGLVAPDLAIERGTDIALNNSWHGITHGKNEFGMLSSIGTIFFVHRLFAREGRSLPAVAGAAVSFTCLVLSRSNTSLFACLLACTCMFLLLRSNLVKQRYTTHLVVGIAALIVVYELAIQHVVPGVDVLLAPIFSMTGKDATFSARTVIWQIIKEHIQYSPWIGTGFGAYWIGAVPSSPSIVFLSSVLALYPTESHNGYLEVMNDLGVLGLVCLALFLVMHIRQTLQLVKVDRPQAALAFGLLFHQMIMNMSESDWFSVSTTWAIIALSSLMVSRALAEAHSPALHPKPGARQPGQLRS